MSLRIKTELLGSCALCLALCVVTTAARADVVDRQDKLDTDPISAPPSHAQNTNRVVPLTARIMLNGAAVDYGAGKQVTFGVFDSSTANGTPILGAILPLKEAMTEHTSGGVFTRTQTGWYLQLATIDKKRTLNVTEREAVDVSGFRLQFSATGSCAALGGNASDICTYTPGVATVPGAYTADTDVPTTFSQSTYAGEVISAETQAALKADGFQRGVAGSSEQVGLDLDVPNAGYTPNADRASENGVSRSEDVVTRPVVSLSHVDQNLYAGPQSAAIDRTIRSFVLLQPHEWSPAAGVMSAAAWILPGLSGALTAPDGKPNLSVSNNLFYAANNMRVPSGSFGVFQTGVGYVATPDHPARSAAETPVSYFNGFWMGFSPVRTTTMSTSSSLSFVGPRTTLSSSFYQGGVGDTISLPTSNITIIDSITNRISQLELSSINDLFVQNGMDLTTQAAFANTTSTETTLFKLVPHVSFSGDRTSGTTVWRYYTGMIDAGKVNAYVGSDFTYATQNGLNIYGHAEAYTHPDRDYYSFVEARVSKTIADRFGNLTFGMGARKEIDRPAVVADALDALDNGSVFDLFARQELTNGLTFDLRERFSREDDNGDNDRSASTTFGVGYRVTNRLNVTAQVTPISDEDAYIQSRLSLSWRVSEDPDAGTVKLQYANIRYRYGSFTGADTTYGDSEKTLLATYQTRF